MDFFRDSCEMSFVVQPCWGHYWCFWRVFHSEHKGLRSDKNNNNNKKRLYLKLTAWSRIPETKGL